MASIRIASPFPSPNRVPVSVPSVSVPRGINTNCVTVSDPSFDSNGNLVGATDAVGNVTTYTRDVLGNCRHPMGHVELLACRPVM